MEGKELAAVESTPKIKTKTTWSESERISSGPCGRVVNSGVSSLVALCFVFAKWSVVL